jgi:hypothetical protein
MMGMKGNHACIWGGMTGNHACRFGVGTLESLRPNLRDWNDKYIILYCTIFENCYTTVSVFEQ